MRAAVERANSHHRYQCGSNAGPFRGALVHFHARDPKSMPSRPITKRSDFSSRQSRGVNLYARANTEINFRNGGSAEGSLARRGGRSIPIGLDLPTQHSQRPLAAPALSKAI